MSLTLRPAPANSAKRGPSGYGSGSETDTSRRTGRPSIRLKNSPPGSPSRPSSRAQSPARAPVVFPTVEEIKAAIPAEGIVLKDLVALFRARVQGRNGEFIAMVKQAGGLDPVSKKIVRKEEGSGAGGASS